LAALTQWYELVRPLFTGDDLPPPLLEALRETLSTAVSERIDRLGGLMEALCESEKHDRIDRRSDLYSRWPELEDFLRQPHRGETGTTDRDVFLSEVETSITRNGRDYIAAIKGLPTATATIGTRWLQGVVDTVMQRSISLLPDLPA
jgi:hypothetical protein